MFASGSVPHSRESHAVSVVRHYEYAAGRHVPLPGEGVEVLSRDIRLLQQMAIDGHRASTLAHAIAGKADQTGEEVSGSAVPLGRGYASVRQ
jgi:hypothetical protein